MFLKGKVCMSGFCGQVLLNCCMLSVFAVVGEFLRLPLSGGLSGVSEGHVVSQHPSEPADLCAGCFQVP